VSQYLFDSGRIDNRAQYRAGLKSEVALLPENSCVVIDHTLIPSFFSDQSLWRDPIHLNDAGNQAIAEVLATAIQKSTEIGDASTGSTETVHLHNIHVYKMGALSLVKALRNLLLVHICWRRYVIGRRFTPGAECPVAKSRLVIGENFYIGRFSQIECDAEIGNHVIFANCVALVGRYDHHYRQIGTPIREASQIRIGATNGRDWTRRW